MVVYPGGVQGRVSPGYTRGSRVGPLTHKESNVRQRSHQVRSYPPTSRVGPLTHKESNVRKRSHLFVVRTTSIGGTAYA